MACYCSVCGDQLSDATENYGEFQTNRGFKGWYIPPTPYYELAKDPRPIIENTCKSCGEFLREVVTREAKVIVERNAERVAERAKMMQDARDKAEKERQEEIEFRRAWDSHRHGRGQ